MVVKIGDIVTRNVCGMKMPLRVTDITDTKIVCGPWEFCRATGAEIDEDLNWGPLGSGSYIEEIAFGKAVPFETSRKS